MYASLAWWHLTCGFDNMDTKATQWLITRWGETPRPLQATDMCTHASSTLRQVTLHVNAIQRRVGFIGALLDPWTTQCSFFKGAVVLKCLDDTPLTLEEVQACVQYAIQHIFRRDLYQILMNRNV